MFIWIAQQLPSAIIDCSGVPNTDLTWYPAKQNIAGYPSISNYQIFDWKDSVHPPQTYLIYCTKLCITIYKINTRRYGWKFKYIIHLGL